MLEHLTEEVRECLACAAEASEKANGTSDPAAKAEFLKMEQRWLQVARSFGRSGDQRHPPDPLFQRRKHQAHPWAQRRDALLADISLGGLRPLVRTFVQAAHGDRGEQLVGVLFFRQRLIEKIRRFFLAEELCPFA